ncbi:hypothetical protein Salat_0054500 [Sesamum alatum]|uniref:Uncharacterized protein n=1 Tax=Sesamum alatum TaxID=300844 RepID=A0AAE1YWU8_9LAMI|nr:hypothetical protein Salat_0054500 [Sesamum alatum]
MKIWKFVKLPCVSFGVPELVSYGFGYDAKSSDFKDKINVNFQFIPSGFANDAILNENPYWLASLDVENEDVKDLPWLDVSELVFTIIPLTFLNLEKEAKVQFVDSRGALVAASAAATTCAANSTAADMELDDTVLVLPARQQPAQKPNFSPLKPHKICNGQIQSREVPAPERRRKPL